MAGNDAVGMSGIEEAFARYQRLDAEELEAAASEAQDRAAIIEGATAPARRRGRVRRARPDERQVESAIIEDGAAAWAEALMRAREAREGDIAGIALFRALEGDASGFDEAAKSAHAISKAELDAQIASADMLRNLLGAAGMATFRLDSAHPLAVAQHMASTAAKSVYTALRAELAERLSLADEGVNTKSSRNRARRAREWAGEVEPARTAFRAASLSLPQLEWAQGAGRPGAWENPRAAMIDADEPEIEKEPDAEARAQEGSVEEPRKGAFAILDDQALAAAIRHHEEHLVEVAISVEALESLGRADEAERSRAHAKFAEANLEMMRTEAEARGIDLPPKAAPRTEDELGKTEQMKTEEMIAVNEVPAEDGVEEKAESAPSETKRDYVYVNVPPDWVHPYMGKPDSDGKRTERCYVVLDGPCEIDGKQAGGLRFFRNMKDFHKQAIAEGKKVTFRFNSNDTIHLAEAGKRGFVMTANPQEIRAAVKTAASASAGNRAEPERSKEQDRQQGYVRITFPPKWAHSYITKPNAEGKVFDKAVVNIPSGTVLSGQSLDGYSADVFLQDFHKQAIEAGRPVTFGFPEDRPVRLFSEGKPDIEADPWMLSTAVKTSREAFTASKNRMVAKTPDRAVKNAGSLRQAHDGAVKAPTAAK